MVKTVLILGGSYGGLHVAHYLLKQKKLDVKVLLVSKNSHFYWNMASVRAIVPGQIEDDALFKPLSAALERYPRERYELIIGSAEKVDPAAKTVLVSLGDGGGDDPEQQQQQQQQQAQRTLSYDQLVIATGSRCTTPDVPWKPLASHAATVASLRAARERVAAARRIVVAGAGATGVEVAGELAFEFGAAKEVTLLAAGPGVLDGDAVGPAALAELRRLGVAVRTRARVAAAAPRPDGTTAVTLAAGGDALVADLYLPTMGMRANAEMLDGKYLNERGYVAVDEFYRVKGLESAGVWAVGDVVSSPRGGFMITQKQAAGVAKNVELGVQGKEPKTVKLMPFDILACAVGRTRGAGRMGSIKMFSAMVYMAKGKTLGVEKLPSYIDGSVA